MKKKRSRYIAFFVNLSLIILLFILRYSGLATLNIGHAIPITLIPLIVAVSLFYGEWYGATAGFFAGSRMNKNIRSAAFLSLGASFLYLFTRQIFFYSFKGITVDAEYYSTYFIPTVIYTAIFIIPFYLIEKKLKNG